MHTLSSACRILLPIHEDFGKFENPKFYNLCGYLHGGVSELAWIALLCWNSSDDYISMLSDQRIDQIEFLMGDRTDLSDYELEKMQQASMDPRYLLGLELFFEAQTDTYKYLMGQSFLTEALSDLYRLDSGKANSLLVEYAPKLVVPTRPQPGRRPCLF